MAQWAKVEVSHWQTPAGREMQQPHMGVEKSDVWRVDIKKKENRKKNGKRDESRLTTAQPCFCISDRPGENGHKCRPGHTGAGPVPPPGW